MEQVRLLSESLAGKCRYVVVKNQAAQRCLCPVRWEQDARPSHGQTARAGDHHASAIRLARDSAESAQCHGHSGSHTSGVSSTRSATPEHWQAKLYEESQRWPTFSCPMMLPSRQKDEQRRPASTCSVRVAAQVRHRRRGSDDRRPRSGAPRASVPAEAGAGASLPPSFEEFRATMEVLDRRSKSSQRSPPLSSPNSGRSGER